MAKQGQDDAARTNDLLEKLIVVQLRGQGVGQEQIARFLGKRNQSISEMLKPLKSTEKEANGGNNGK